jgi:hypothetical protein
MLGGNFFGEYGSAILYKSGLFAPTGDLGKAAVKIHERDDLAHASVCPVHLEGTPPSNADTHIAASPNEGVRIPQVQK